jgi:hypothetical protein
MTIFSKTVPPPGLFAVHPSVERKALTKSAQYEIERLTENLFYRKSGLQYRSVLMVDLGGNTSSLWVATGVASVLSKTIRNMVHVLAVGGKASEINRAYEEVESDSPSGYILEHIADPSSAIEGINVLIDRLSAIKADGLVAIVHLSQSKDQSINLSRVDFVEGVILLVRATHTRRASLARIEQQLAIARTPLLGSVLLDRDYPIPENIYRLL